MIKMVKIVFMRWEGWKSSMSLLKYFFLRDEVSLLPQGIQNKTEATCEAWGVSLLI